MKKKQLFILFASMQLVLPLSMHGATKTWVGATSDLKAPANWSLAGAPGISDSAVFTTTGTHATTLQAVSPNGSNMSVLDFTFIDPATPYTVTLDGNGGGTATLDFYGNGVDNQTNQIQTFNLINTDDTITFHNSSSADKNFSGLATYNLNVSADSFLKFTDSSGASNANINTTQPANIAFDTNAKSESAKFNLQNVANLKFFNNSICGSTASGFQTTINAFDTVSIEFDDTSDPNNAIINLHDSSTLLFNTTGVVGHGGPLLTLSESAAVTLTQPIQIRSLNSSSATTSVDIGTDSLTLHEAAGMHDVYSGAIKGTGTLIMNAANKNGSLELTSSQDPLDTWDANVLQGTLIGNTTNLNRAISVTDPGIVVFNQQSNGTFNESITGNGTLIKAGVANLVIASDNSSFDGTTKIFNGNLVLNGQLGGTIKVFSVLSGSGIANGTVIVKNGGIISPGNFHVGTLTAGDYINQPNGVYYTQVRGNGTSDLIHVTSSGTNGTGKATLNGGTVFATSGNGTFLIDTPYTIVTANGGVSGTYTRAITDINAYLDPRLRYDAKHVYLILGTDFEAYGDTDNQRNTAEQIDSIRNPSEELQAFLQGLITLTPSQLRDALDELSGVQYASLFPTLQQASERFYRGINLPIRLGQCGCNPDPCQCVEVWGDIQYGRSCTKKDSNAHGYKGQNISGFIASQVKASPCVNLGAALFYENDIIRSNLNGKTRMDTVMGSLFGSVQACNCYFLTDFIGGYSHNNVSRHIDFSDVDINPRGHPRIYNFTSYTEVGCTTPSCWCMCWQPFIGAELGYYHLNKFKEGSGNPVGLEGKSQDYKSCDSFVGVRLKTAGIWGVDFAAEVSWQHRYNTSGNKIKLEFQDFGDAFNIKGPKQTRDAVVLSLLSSFNICNDIRILAEAYGEKWEKYGNYSFGLGLDVKW